mmetsp:Transcript_39384/g.70570  ORF Transcript_39384/g.70570 Transcript_39384/m.70570 type:complete len:108 (+) Transcript_39384:268-591(+)
MSSVGGTRQRYTRLSQSDQTQRYSSVPETTRVPYQTIGLAVALLVAGVLLLLIGAFQFKSSGKNDKGWGLVTLGTLTFIPGFHQTRIAYYAARGRRGYSFNDMPQVM